MMCVSLGRYIEERVQTGRTRQGGRVEAGFSRIEKLAPNVLLRYQEAAHLTQVLGSADPDPPVAKTR